MDIRDLEVKVKVGTWVLEVKVLGVIVTLLEKAKLGEMERLVGMGILVLEDVRREITKVALLEEEDHAMEVELVALGVADLVVVEVLTMMIPLVKVSKFSIYSIVRITKRIH